MIVICYFSPRDHPKDESITNAYTVAAVADDDDNDDDVLVGAVVVMLSISRFVVCLLENQMNSGTISKHFKFEGDVIK